MVEKLYFIYQAISLIAGICFFVPFITLLLKRLQRIPEFCWFTIYWLLAGLVNLLFYFKSISSNPLGEVVERVYNLADAPIMLFILYKTVNTESVWRSIRKVLPVYLCAALIITFSTRLPENAETVLVGIGLGIILLYLIWVLVFYNNKVNYNPVAYTQRIIFFALLFEYGISIITFIFSYIIPERSNIYDSFLIFHLSIIFSTSLAAYGLIRYRKNQKRKPKEPVIRIWESEIKYL